MATAISVALFQSAMGEVYDAIVTPDFALAHSWLARAEAQLNGLLVQSTTSEGTTDSMRVSLESMRKSLIDTEKRQPGSRFEKHSRWII